MTFSASEKKDLLSDYCVLGGSKDHRLSDVERMTLVGGGSLLKLLNRVAKEPFTLDFTDLVREVHPEDIQNAATFYQSLSIDERFAKPKGIIAPKIIPVHGFSNEGEICDLQFESCYQPIHPSFQKLTDAMPENRTVTVRHWKHVESNRPTIIAVHGFSMGDQKQNSLAFLPGLFFRLGFDVALFELPFHGRRISPGFRDCGLLMFPHRDPHVTNECIFQAISDLRQLRLILRALGTKMVGAMGVSLGAYTTSLWATLDDLAFCIPMVPLVSFSKLLKKDFEKVRPGDDGLFRELERCFSVHEPTSFIPKTSSEKVMIVAGTEDRVISSYHPETLSNHFKGAPLIWFSGDHDMNSERDFVFGEIFSFFRKTGLIE